MKNYLIENRFKFLGWTSILLVGIVLGFMARPGFDKFALAFEDKPYVAPKSDVDMEIEKYLASAEYQSEYKAEAEARVKLQIASRLNNEAGIAAKKSEQYQMRALNGISPETATATIVLEKAQGRR